MAGSAAFLGPACHDRHCAGRQRGLSEPHPLGRGEIAVQLALDVDGFAGLDGHQVGDAFGPGRLDDVVAVVFQVLLGGAFQVGAAPVVRAAHGLTPRSRISAEVFSYSSSNSWTTSLRVIFGRRPVRFCMAAWTARTRWCRSEWSSNLTVSIPSRAVMTASRNGFRMSHQRSLLIR